MDKPTIETCLGLVAVSLSLVMAGSGDLDAFRQIRSLRLRPVDNDLTYGNHMAIGMALGFLFLGGGRGTLNTSNLAIAALVISLYPHFPLSSTDNRYHLQAARHMYVLAVQQRCLEVRDVDTRLPCLIPLQIKLKPSPTAVADTSSISCMAPCVLPDLETIATIEVASNRYWPVKLDIEQNAAHRRLLSSGQIVYVKRKTGHISYAQDPRGLRSIIARSVPGVTDLGAGSDEHSTAEFVQCFSEDPNVLAFARLFCSRMDDSGATGRSATSGSDEDVSFCTNVLHECLAHDKPEILTTYLSIYFHLRQLDAKPDVQVSGPPTLTLAVRSCSRFLSCDQRPNQTTSPPRLQAIAGIKFILAFYASPLPQKVASVSDSRVALHTSTTCPYSSSDTIRLAYSLAAVLRARCP